MKSTRPKPSNKARSENGKGTNTTISIAGVSPTNHPKIFVEVRSINLNLDLQVLRDRTLFDARLLGVVQDHTFRLPPSG